MRVEELCSSTRRVLDQCFEGGFDVGIARRLAAGQGTGIAAQKRQMLGDGLRCGQEKPSRYGVRRSPAMTRQARLPIIKAPLQKKFHTPRNHLRFHVFCG